MARKIDVLLSLKDQFTGKMDAATKALIKQQRQIKHAGNEIKNMGRKMEQTGKSMTQKVSVPVAGLGVAALKTGMDFDAAMSQVSAVSGASGENFDALRAKAREMGASTKFSATESAEAMNYMAMAGWKTKDMLGGIEGVMNLAAASGEDLATTSDIVTDAMTAFGLSADGTTKVIKNGVSKEVANATHFADVLAAASSNANTNVAMMGETFKYAAPVAGALGYSLEDTAANIGLMANAGIKASQAGTAMRGWMTRMAKPTKESAKAMADLGLSITDSSGKMKPLRSITEDMRRSFKNLTEDQKAQYAAMLAGQEGMSGLLAVVDASEKDYKKLTGAIEGCDGAAVKMADTMQDNLAGQIQILKSNAQDLAISFSDILTPDVKKAAKWSENLLKSFNGLSDGTKEVIVKASLLAAAAGPVLMIGGKVQKSIGNAVVSFSGLGKKMKAFKGTMQETGGVLKKIEMPKWSMPTPLTKGFGALKHAAGKATAPIRELNSKVLGSVSGKMRTAGSAAGKFGGHMFTAAKNTRLYQGAAKAAHVVTAPLGKAFTWAFAPLKKVPGMFGGAGKAIFTMLGPAGTAVAVMGGIAVAGVLVYKNWDKVKAAAKGLGSTIKSAFLASGVDVDKLRASVQRMKDNVTSAFAGIGKAGKGMWKTLKPVAKVIGGTFVTAIVVGFKGIIGAGAGLLSGITTIAEGLTKTFKGIIKFVTGVFTGNWKKAWSGVKDIFGGIFQSLKGLAKAPINAVIGMVNSLIKGVNDKASKIPGIKHIVNIPTIPMLYKGTKNWKGGLTSINERGGEIVDLPRGTRVYPHDESVRRAREEGKTSISVKIAKLADTIIVREEEDIDRVAEEVSKKLIFAIENM